MKDLRPGLQPTLNKEQKQSELFVTRQSIFQAWAKLRWSATWLPSVIKDHLINVGGVTKVLLSKELLVSASSARQRYQTHLDEEKRKNVEKRRGWKRAAVLDELNDLKEQKKRMKSNIEELFESADDLAGVNAMRRSAKEKEGELKSTEEEINKKLATLTN